MKRILLALIVLALPCLSLAAPADSTALARANSLRDGAWAMRVSFENSFNGGQVALKYHLTPKDALRVGLSLFGRLNDEEGNYSGDEVVFETDDVQLDVEAIYLRYPRPVASANIFFGAGPFVDFSERSSRRSESDYENTSDTEFTELGIVAVVGVEWFASQALSLHVEYAASVGHIWGERTETSFSPTQPSEVRESDIDGWALEFGRTVFFGFGIYF